MTQSADTVLDRVRAKAVSTAGYLGRIEAAHGAGNLTALDAEQAYRGAFLSFHSVVENTLEYLFLGLLRGRITHRLAAVQPLITVKSDLVATRLVFEGRKYADWLPYTRHTYERAKIYFSSGRPFTSLAAGDRLALDQLTVLRNALAHESGHAVRLFRRTFTDGKALPPEQRRPAGYLRGYHAAGQLRFDFLTAQAAKALESLA